MVERVIDHFFNPHPRAYVVLTMRSEHLNDCAALPRASRRDQPIARTSCAGSTRTSCATRSSSRRSAILRLVARGAEQPEALRRTSPSSRRVLDALLRDVQGDQRTTPTTCRCCSTCSREAVAGGARDSERRRLQVPARNGSADLARGGRRRSGPSGARRARQRAARAASRTGPRRSYRRRPPEPARAARRGAARARVQGPEHRHVHAAADQRRRGRRAARPGATRADLRALVADGFVGSVDYLFWDDEDQSRVTLKVSHKSR